MLLPTRDFANRRSTSVSRVDRDAEIVTFCLGPCVPQRKSILEPLLDAHLHLLEMLDILFLESGLAFGRKVLPLYVDEVIVNPSVGRERREARRIF